MRSLIFLKLSKQNGTNQCDRQKVILAVGGRKLLRLVKTFSPLPFQVKLRLNMVQTKKTTLQSEHR